MEEEFLSNEKKKLILEFWEKSSESGTPPSLEEVSRTVLGVEYDGRTMDGRDLKKYISSFGLESSPEKSPKKIELSADQKAYVENHRGTMTAIEMAKELFGNPKLINLSGECRAVDEFVLTFGPHIIFGQETIPQKDWNAPNTMERVVSRVNRYFKMGTELERDKLTPKQKKEMSTLMRYLNTYRFTSQINRYESEEDRTLFESTFIRYAYNKSDLTEEEIDQYILLAKEAVLERITMSLITQLRKKADEYLCGDDEKAKLSFNLVEIIGKTTKDYDDCCKRQNNLVNSLKQKRSDRLAQSQSENASILNIIEVWRIEKSRKEWIAIAEKRKEVVREEIGRLSNMSDVMCKMMGISEEEAING